MSKRFPHHHPSHRDETTAPAGPAGLDAADQFFGPRLMRDSSTAVPDRACCCPAKPLVKVVMPARHGRSPVDLWLCGHHWRASRAALREAGASVYDVSPESLPANGVRENASV